MTNINHSKAVIVRNEFERRKALNSNYSLRAFSRDLDISHTLLSLITSGKRKISSSLSMTLINKLNLSKEEENILKIGIPVKEVQVSSKISLEKASLIADWVYYAILSLLEVKEFKWDPAWVSHRLGISREKAKRIMDRLLKFELIKVDEDGRYRQCQGSIVVENKQSNESFKSYNHNLIKKALESMNSTQFEQRDLSSTVFALDPTFIPYAVERIRNFRRSLSNELEHLGEKKEVYALTVQIFPLSKKEVQK